MIWVRTKWFSPIPYISEKWIRNGFRHLGWRPLLCSPLFCHRWALQYFWRSAGVRLTGTPSWNATRVWRITRLAFVWIRVRKFNNYFDYISIVNNYYRLLQTYFCSGCCRVCYSLSKYYFYLYIFLLNFFSIRIYRRFSNS